MVKFILGICCLLFYAVVSGQHFKYEATLPAVDSSAFYKLEIPPVVAGKSQVDFADLRLLDKDLKENPYIVKTSTLESSGNDFNLLPIVSRGQGANGETYIIIENASKNTLQDLLLFIRNTEAQRAVILSGGEDTTNWYIIKEDVVLENITGSALRSSFTQRIAFPAVNYRYLKITNTGKNLLPVNITKAGFSSNRTSTVQYLPLPLPVITTIDSSDKRTYIFLKFNDTYQIDKVELDFTGPKFYKRNLAVYPGNNAGFVPLQFITASNIPASFTVQARTRDLLIVVENEDNPPLQARVARGWQLNKYLLTYLEKGKNYTLFFGDSTAIAPKYDLSFFSDSIPRVLPVVHPGAVKKTVVTAAVKKDNPFVPPVILWLVIAGVLCLLLFACYKLLKDLERKKEENIL